MSRLSGARDAHSIPMKTLPLLAAALVLFQSRVPIAAADSTGRQVLTTVDFDRVQALSDPQVAPDGAWNDMRHWTGS